MTSLPPTTDLTNARLSTCDKEKIHTPLAIQPYGALLAFEAKTLCILRISKNLSAILGISATEALGQSLDGVLGSQWQANILATLAASPCFRPSYVRPPPDFCDSLHALVHRTGMEVVVEWLRLPTITSAEAAQLQQRTVEALRKFSVAESLQSLCQIAADEIRLLTNFDRVMIYAFDLSFNGEVLAESRHSSVDSFLGLRFPASDIPKSARDLYVKNPSRLIYDVEYEPVKIFSDDQAVDGLPLDQSQSALRSVSPIHREYLRNMNVRSSMSTSLLKKGKLWGLISCANCQRVADISFQAWLALETIAEVFMARLGEQIDGEEITRRAQASNQISSLANSVAEATHLGNVLWHEREKLLSLMQADGAAWSHRGDVVLMGDTPPARAVRQLIDWLPSQKSMADQGFFATHELKDIDVWQNEHPNPFCGVLVIAISQNSPQQSLLWFRKEVLTTVRWGGNPNKPVTRSEGSMRIHPRKSFELYKEVVRHQAVPWQELHFSIAKEVKAVVVDHLIGRTERLEDLNDELRRSNLELDSFAYAASHDLKEPVRGIHHYVSFLQHEQKDNLDVQGNERLMTIERLTQRMDNLLDSLLEYAKIGRAVLDLQEHNFADLCASTIEMLGPWLDSRQVTVAFPEEPCKVVCDAVRFMEVLSNLIANAAKYNDKESAKWVKVGWSQDGKCKRFYVRDNGIGMTSDNLERPFQLFKRLHAKDAFGGGSGTGLTLAKAIVERHGGRIWLTSQVGQGTTVYFTVSPT